MNDLPKSSEDYRSLAGKLVRFLHEEIGNTDTRTGWTKRNIEVLQRFADRERLVSSPDKRNGKDEKQFLWDFVAYKANRGLVLVAESEWANKTKDREAFQHDFEKLLYVRSPVKLMICWAKSKEKAEKLRGWVSELMRPSGRGCTCSEFSPGEIFLLYCTCSRECEFAYWLQINGQPGHLAVTNERFASVPMEWVLR